jgi:two-component system nitrate/nitrite sensor histidine kinase NarX
MIKQRIRDKIIGLLLLYFFVALLAIGATLMASWRLEGGAAAINDAGRERMRSYRIAYLLQQQVLAPTVELQQAIRKEMSAFESSLLEIAQGNPKRPLFLPKNIEIRSRMAYLIQSWQGNIKPQITKILNSNNKADQQIALENYRPMLERYVVSINTLVSLIERSNAKATLYLRSLQIVLMVLALLGTVLLVYLFMRMVVRPVTQLREGMQRMTTGDFAVRLPVNSQDELGELAVGFNRMADELQDLYNTLEQRVEEKTRSIESKNIELATLDKEMVITEQRNLLAQELHDSIAQSLAFLNIQVQLLQEDFKQAHHNEVEQGLVKIREGVQESYDDVRELLVHFRTRIGGTDLATAISGALEKFEGQTSIKTSFNITGEMPVLSAERVLQVLHILQESLSNARKHAHASLINVELACAEQCVINIQDNGVGFDVTQDAGDSHVGLRIMRERAHRIGAQIFFRSSSAKGTHICLILAE